MSAVPPWLRDVANGSNGVVGVDTTCFIHHFEANVTFGRAAGELFGAVEAGFLRARVSVVALTEILTLPLREGRKDLVGAYRDVFESFPNLALVEVDAEVALSAAELRASLGLRTPDALHVASALASGAGAFVTSDARLRTPEGLRLVLLPETGGG